MFCAGGSACEYLTDIGKNNACYNIQSVKAIFFLVVGTAIAWIIKDQLDVTCFIISLFNAQHVSDANTSILRSLRLICWVISWVVLLWFDVCWWYVVVWLGWCGIRMRAEALVLQPTHNEPEQYNPWNNSTYKSQAPEDECINIRNMLSIKWRNNKARDIKLVSLYSTERTII